MSFGPSVGLWGPFRLISGNSFPSVAADAPQGGWSVGDVCLNTAPTQGLGPSYWQCTTAGSPGTWTAFPTGTSASVTITGTSNTLTSANDLVIANTASATVTAALPSATGLNGKTLYLKRTSGANIATFTGAVDGGTTSLVLPSGTTYSAAVIKSDGTQWWCVATFGTPTIT